MICTSDVLFIYFQFLVKAVDALNPIGKGEDDSQVGGVRIPDNIEFRLRSAKNVDGVIKKIKKVKLNDGNGNLIFTILYFKVAFIGHKQGPH